MKVRGCTTQCTAPPTLVALLGRLTSLCIRRKYASHYIHVPPCCFPSYLSFDLTTAEYLNGSHVKTTVSTTKVPSVLGLLSEKAPLSTPMRLTSLARELVRESIPRRCCGTRYFPSLSRSPSSSRWTIATVPVTVLPLCVSLGEFTSLSGTQKPRLLSSLVLPLSWFR